MKATINLSLSREEAEILAKFLRPDSLGGVLYEEAVVENIKEQLCEILDVKPWDL